MANRRKLTDYSESEINLIKETTVKAATYGFALHQSAELVGLSLRQLQSLIEADNDFRVAYESSKTEGLKNVAAKMHELALKGSYQAQAFILARDPNSPYSDESKLDPRRQEALETLLAYITDKGNLLPFPHKVCPKCGTEIPDNSYSPAQTTQDDLPTTN